DMLLRWQRDPDEEGADPFSGLEAALTAATQ
ncbi:phage tail protein, partial [Salmonella enterica subsp. enterica serovar Virchow]|nr:phage tail protein [Salmonella enterica subsp. enterica serovar Virchow]